jgi:hypothetical protein
LIAVEVTIGDGSDDGQIRVSKIGNPTWKQRENFS